MQWIFFWSAKGKHRLVFLFFGIKFRPEKYDFYRYKGFSMEKENRLNFFRFLRLFFFKLPDFYDKFQYVVKFGYMIFWMIAALATSQNPLKKTPQQYLLIHWPPSLEFLSLKLSSFLQRLVI